MTTNALLAILADRGLKVVVRAGVPHLTGQVGEATDTLLRVLKLPEHRAAILGKLASEPEIPDFGKPIECRWPYGHIFSHTTAYEGWPTGARWWRYVGDVADTWRAIPECERLAHKPSVPEPPSPPLPDRHQIADPPTSSWVHYRLSSGTVLFRAPDSRRPYAAVAWRLSPSEPWTPLPDPYQPMTKEAFRA